ncbi:hypothetical protein LLE81_00255 [Staphylococcus epidermidis]|nr:hypothetical protein [Staphylococcus epidermidis]
MLSTRKLLLSLAAAVILIGGYAYADQVVDEPVVHQVQVESDYPAAVSARVVPAVHYIRSLQDYETTPARSDMRVASAGLVFDRIDRSPPASTWL